MLRYMINGQIVDEESMIFLAGLLSLPLQKTKDTTIAITTSSNIFHANLTITSFLLFLLYPECASGVFTGIPSKLNVLGQNKEIHLLSSF